MEKTSFKIKSNPPFRLDLTAWALRRRLNNIVDQWIDESWSRIFVIGGEPVSITVSQKNKQSSGSLDVGLVGQNLDSDIEKGARALVKKCLGTSTDLSSFYLFASRDEKLALLAERYWGFKPPRFPTVFEAAVNGIACQQISLNAGIALLNHLASTRGVQVRSGTGMRHAFPRPEDLSKLKPEDFKKFGFSRQKGLAVIELAKGISDGQLNLEQLASLNEGEALDRLFQLRGIGRWTGEYILLRGLGRLNVFPADDAGGRRGLQHWLKLPKKLEYKEIQNLVAKWKPYAGLVYFHLLLNRLSEEGYLG